MKTLLFNLLLPFMLIAQNQMNISDFAASITAKELKENLYIYASDYFQGRETGTIGQRRAVDFLQNFYSTHGIEQAKGTYNYTQPRN